MDFFRVYPPDEDGRTRQSAYLVYDNWDDFHFKTSFDAYLFDTAGKRHKLGGVKILKKGMQSGKAPVPDQFTTLDATWCSLGAGRDYYMSLMEVDEATRVAYLKAIRDCAFEPTIFQEFRDEEGMRGSLLRNVSYRDVEKSFPAILRGDSELTPFKFEFVFPSGELEETEKVEFAVEPSSKPPTNVHVIIGRNGVGKTRLLAGMADALTENKSKSVGLPGTFQFIDEETEFLNVVVVSYSAFDRFDPISIGRRKSKISIPYFYIGIKDLVEDAFEADKQSVVVKSNESFTSDFRKALTSLVDPQSGDPRGPKYSRWENALRVLCSDPGIAEFSEHFFGDAGIGNFDVITEQFNTLSSGHKIVLLTIARLVESVSDRSLVLIDEPETHLHPPLLGSFIRAMSELLISQNGVAIVATHSPVVLQEVPKKCVTVVSRSGSRIRVSRPDSETFAENVGTLTRKVFGLEVTKSGFYRLLHDSAEGGDFNAVIDEFSEQIGSEGRALARVFTTDNEAE